MLGAAGLGAQALHHSFTGNRQVSPDSNHLFTARRFPPETVPPLLRRTLSIVVAVAALCLGGFAVGSSAGDTTAPNLVSSSMPGSLPDGNGATGASAQEQELSSSTSSTTTTSTSSTNLTTTTTVTTTLGATSTEAATNTSSTTTASTSTSPPIGTETAAPAAGEGPTSTSTSPLAGPSEGVLAPVVKSQNSQPGTAPLRNSRSRPATRKRHRKSRSSAAVQSGGTLAGQPPQAPATDGVNGIFGLPPDPLASAGFGALSNPLAGSPFGSGGEVPRFFIETFKVPPFLLPIYWEAELRYGVPWEVLAAINEVETDYGLDLNISSAGAEGWMQFLPGTWMEYGVDAVGAGVRDPYNPADAIFAAARYLRAAGSTSSLRSAIFSYNHSEIYVESVLLRARLLAGTPPAMLDSLAEIARQPGTAFVARANAARVGKLPPVPAKAAAAKSGLPPAQWHQLVSRLAALPLPRVPLKPTSAALPDRPGGVDLPPPGRLSAAQLAADLGSLAASAQPQASTGTLSFQPVLGLPSRQIQLIGAAPGESPGSEEVWAQAQIAAIPATADGQQISNATVLLRYTRESGWQVVPIADAQGNALSFTPVADRVTTNGGIVLLGSDATKAQSILVRDPGGAFAEAPAPSASTTGPVLGSGEQLYSSSGTPLVSALDEPVSSGGSSSGTGIAGALIVPQEAPAPSGGGSAGTVLPPGVLHYDGTSWTREPLCTKYAGGACTAAPSGLSMLALAASSPSAAWLLASSASQPLMLFQRDTSTSGTPVWVLQEPASWMLRPRSEAPTGFSVGSLGAGPMLTATSEGVWVDAHLTGPPPAAGATEIDGDATLFVPYAAVGAPAGSVSTWCYPDFQQLCPGGGSLGALLPTGTASSGSSIYESFAWPQSGQGGTGTGTRLIVGLPRGAILRFSSSGNFSYLPGGGGFGASSAAFVSPQEGWLYGASGSSAGSLNYHQGAQLLHVTTSPVASQLQSWPVPFRRPLTAIAAAPGAVAGEANAQALAVGDHGQVARYIPGQGWTPEYLYDGSGNRKEPSLRGVAWPEAGRAYAVGSGGEMWLWRAETGLWEPDPAKPLDFHGNLNAIAFDPSNPSIGYAVGKQGVLLSYDKTWTQASTIPPALAQATFTSVAFAGNEAIVGYRLVSSTGQETGGVLVNEDTGSSSWQIDPGVQALLSQISNQGETVISKVAGLPDGGAVAAGPGLVIERDSASAPWHFSSEPLPEAANIAALAAVSEGSSVRALVSVDTDVNSLPNGLIFQTIDNPPASAPGQPGLYLGADPLPATGYLLRETAGGWQDLQNQAYPEPEATTGDVDLPDWPDPVLALAVGTSGEGWAVGGQTGAALGLSAREGAQTAVQTAAVLRLGSGNAPPQSESAAAAPDGGEATFALGGNAQCAELCSSYVNTGVGPNAWLAAAVARAGQISGLHAFLYTGARIGRSGGRPPSAEAFQREMEAYAGLLGGGPLPVYAAVSPSDLEPAGGVGMFTATLAAHAPAGSAPTGSPAPPAGSAAYAFESPGNGGSVRVIVLDYSKSTLGAAQTQWLSEQLQQAKAVGVPAIVLGNGDPVQPSASNYARDAATLTQVLMQGQASAYFYDSPGENRSDMLGTGSGAVPAYGTGTLGYVLPPLQNSEEFLGAGGFLLAHVNVAQRNQSNNRAPVSVTLIPNISQLALNATGGTLLRRSQVALFEGLARRPSGGEEQEGSGSDEEELPDPYVPVPEICQGPGCGHFIAPAYTFTSSRPDIGNFVERDPSNANPRAVLQGPNGKPIPDPQSGLFCAFNAGTTTVTIQTGGLSYSEQVTVQAGSVEQPCGTVPLINPPPATSNVAATLPPPPPPGVAPAGASPAPVVPPAPVLPPPLAPTPRVPAAKPVAHPAPPPFFAVAPPVAALLAVPFPPPPTPARPTPPSGTAPVFGQALAPKEEQEDEEAVESARANMSAYVPDQPHLPPGTLLALIVIAAGAGVTIRRSRQSRRSGYSRPSHWTPARAEVGMRRLP
jgi:hypothetical protein